MAADRDAGNQERDPEVQHQRDAEAGLHRVDAARAHREDRRAHRPEDRARGADRDRVGRQQQRTERAADQRHEVDDPEAQLADRGLHQRAEEVQEVHVEGEVQQPGVQEAGADDPPPFAVGDERAEQRAVLVDGPRRPEAPAARGGREGEHVDRHQDVGQLRRAGQRRGGAHLRLLARALRTAHPDRRRGHAVRADRPPAGRARDACLAIGMAVAGRRRVARLLGHHVDASSRRRRRRGQRRAPARPIRRRP